MYKFVYDFPFVKDMFLFVFLPLIVIIFSLVVVLVVYAVENRKNKDLIHIYKINFYSLILSIIMTSIFFAIVLGFAFALKDEMNETGLETFITYLVLISPLIPVIVLALLIGKTIKLVNNKPVLEKKTVPTKKVETKKTTTRKTPATKKVAEKKKAPAKKSAPKKTTTKKTSTKKVASTKAAAKKTTTKKAATTKKSTTRKTTTKKK